MECHGHVYHKESFQRLFNSAEGVIYSSNEMHVFSFFIFFYFYFKLYNFVPEDIAVRKEIWEWILVYHSSFLPFAFYHVSYTKTLCTTQCVVVFFFHIFKVKFPKWNIWNLLRILIKTWTLPFRSLSLLVLSPTKS